MHSQHYDATIQTNHLDQVAYPRTAVVIPIRSFSEGKTRLGPSLTRTDRAALIQRMASGVVRAARGLPVLIVTSAPEVQAWAWELGLGVIDDPGTLDAAAAAGTDWARSQLFGRVVIAHADLSLAHTLCPVLTRTADAGLILVVGKDGGTPVMSLPTRTEFRYSYGHGSYRRHLAEGIRLGLPVVTVHDKSLATDLDTPSDLAQYGDGAALPWLEARAV